MSDLNVSAVAFDHLSVWAARYALGRATYAVGDVVDTLIENRAALSQQSRDVICRDIEQALERGAAGMDMDVRQWKRLRDVLMGEPVPA